MNRPGVRFLRWNKPAHLSRTSTSSMFRSFQSACLQRKCYRNQDSVRSFWNKLLETLPPCVASQREGM